MGLFDNLLRTLDDGLKAVESGELEKKLDKFAEAVETRSKQADHTLGKLADRPGELLKAAEKKTVAVEQKAAALAKPLRRKIDI
jgi:hypothetical protein